MKKSKIILIAFAGLLLFSCQSTKRVNQTDKSESQKTVERKTITRPGDTITIDIPNIRYKDTTITNVNYENRTVASVHYDKDGNQRFECLSAELKEEMELIRETIKNDIEDETDVERSFNPQYFIYAIAALALIVVVGLSVLGFIVMRVQKGMPEMTAKIVKDLIK